MTTPLGAASGAEHGQPDNSELEEEELENEAQLRAITSRDLEKGLAPHKSHKDGEAAGSGDTSPTAASPPSPPVDPNLVTWDGPNDPTNPKNWTFKQKWAVTATVSFFTLMRYDLYLIQFPERPRSLYAQDQLSNSWFHIVLLDQAC